MALDRTLFSDLAKVYPNIFNALYVPTGYDLCNIKTPGNPFIFFREMVKKIGATVEDIDLEERRIRAEATEGARRKLLQAHKILHHLMVVKSFTRTTSTRTTDSYRWEHDQSGAPLSLEGVVVLKTTMTASDLKRSAERCVPGAVWVEVAKKMLDTTVDIEAELRIYVAVSKDVNAEWRVKLV
jgi:hypothetical protein